MFCERHYLHVQSQEKQSDSVLQPIVHTLAVEHTRWHDCWPELLAALDIAGPRKNPAHENGKRVVKGQLAG